MLRVLLQSSELFLETIECSLPQSMVSQTHSHDYSNEHNILTIVDMLEQFSLTTSKVTLWLNFVCVQGSRLGERVR